MSSSEVDLRESGLSALALGVREGLLDLGFCYGTEVPEVLDGLMVHVLARGPVTVAVPETMALTQRGPVSWSVLDGCNWIMPSASPQYREDMLARFERHDVKVKVVAEATTLTSQLALVSAGIGATFTSPWIPATAGIHLAQLYDEPPLELLMVHTDDLRPAARDLVAAVQSILTSAPDSMAATPREVSAPREISLP